MANSLFSTMNMAKNGANVQNFAQFMQSMRGQNPTQIINSMVQSGKITQQQLNQVQHTANGMMKQFDSFKNMFGF